MVSAINVANDGGAVTSGLVGAIRFPDFFSRFAIKSDDVGVTIMVAVDNHFVFPENGAGAVAMFAGKGTWANFP